MAKKQFKCPNCGAAGTITIDPILHVSKDPDAKARVLCGEYFQWECPQCAKQYLIDDVFLYYDDLKGLMVYYVPGHKKPTLPVPTLIRTKDDFDWHGSTLRVTSRFLDLAEKIRIFDAGLDDRVVEAVKFYCNVNFEKAGQTAHNILFEELDADDTLFFSVYHGDNCTGLPVPMAGYLRAQSDFARFFDAMPDDQFVMVDQHWLTQLLSNSQDA